MSNTMKYKDFLGSVDFSSEDECFYGKIIGITDLVTFEGTSIVELKQSFHNAVDDYIEMCTSIGKKPMKSYKGSFNVRIGSELHRNAALYAAANHKTLNAFVTEAITSKLQELR